MPPACHRTLGARGGCCLGIEEQDVVPGRDLLGGQADLGHERPRDAEEGMLPGRIQLEDDHSVRRLPVFVNHVIVGKARRKTSTEIGDEGSKTWVDCLAWAILVEEALEFGRRFPLGNGSVDRPYIEVEAHGWRLARRSEVWLSVARGPWYSRHRRRAASLVGHRAEIAQLVEHATENRGVASSILALGTTIWWSRFASGSGSVGRASPCQGEGRGFESRLPLHFPARGAPGTALEDRPLPLRLVVGQRTLDP
jgi:hypothetical protein